MGHVWWVQVNHWLGCHQVVLSRASDSYSEALLVSAHLFILPYFAADYQTGGGRIPDDGQSLFQTGQFCGFFGGEPTLDHRGVSSTSPHYI